MKISLKLENPLPLSANLSLAQEAELAGLARLWVAEYARHDAIAQLAALACATERIELGSSILPIYTRSATLIGMAAATLAELSDDRVCLGLGASTETIIEGWHGTLRQSPLQALRDYVDIVRAVARGERVEHRGTVMSAEGFRYLGRPTQARIGLAALGPRMRRLAGEIADVVLLNFVPTAGIARAQQDVAAGADAAGRPRPRLTMDLRVALGEGSTRRAQRERARKLLASYGRVAPYNAHFARMGYEAQARLLSRAWSSGRPHDAVAAVDDAMLDDILVAGSVDDILTRVRELRDAGLDEVILYPLVDEGDEQDTLQTVLYVAQEAHG